jgi:hypothetical protein
MSTTVNKDAYLPVVAGDPGVWGGYLNTRTFVTFDEALGATSTISVSNATYTLSATEAASAILRVTGTITADISIVTTCRGFTFVENVTSGAYNVSITNGHGSLTVPQGCVSLVIFDNTNGPRMGAISFASSADVLAGISSTLAVTPASLSDNFSNHYNSIKFQTINASTSSITIDMSLGWYVSLILNATVSSITIINWPSPTFIGKLIIGVNNTGSFDISGWPSGIVWSGGATPTITKTPGGKDTIVITSTNISSGGRGYQVGANMQ